MEKEKIASIVAYIYASKNYKKGVDSDTDIKVIKKEVSEIFTLFMEARDEVLSYEDYLFELPGADES